MDELLKYLMVMGVSGLKFIFGPTLATTFGYSIVLSGILSTLGMMIPVYILTYFGHEMRRFIKRFQRKDRRIFTQKSRRFVRIWRQYGVKGIAFFSPLFLTPIGGAFLANAMGGIPSKIIKWMWISALVWGQVLSWLVKNAYWILQDFGIV